MTEVQPPAEPEVSKEVTPAVTTETAPTAEAPPTDPAALDEWALGRVMSKRPELFQQQPQPTTTAPKVEMTPGYPDVPKHPLWDKWEEEGNTDAQQAYVGGVQAANLAVNGVKKEVQDMRGEYGRNQTILEASQNLTDDMRPYMAKAVQNVEAMNGGPIPGHHPIMVRMVENEARRLYMDAGAHLPKKTVPGETVPGASSEPAFPRSVIEAEKKVFVSMGMTNVTDQFVIDHLKEQGAVPV